LYLIILPALRNLYFYTLFDFSAEALFHDALAAVKRDPAAQNLKSLSRLPEYKQLTPSTRIRNQSKAMARCRSFSAAASARADIVAEDTNQASVTSPAGHGIRFIQAKGTVPLFFCGTQCPQRPRSSSFFLISVIYTFHGNYFSPSRSTLRSLFTPSLTTRGSTFLTTSRPIFNHFLTDFQPPEHLFNTS